VTRRARSAVARLDHVERELQVRGHLDAARRRRLLETANRCPVRAFQAAVTARTRLVDPPVTG
jgi:hypothetical protein